jgi:hypothetical protein
MRYFYLGYGNVIFWDEVYFASDERYLSWCYSGERIPVSVVPTADGTPHIGAMTMANDSTTMHLISINDNITLDSVFCMLVYGR